MAQKLYKRYVEVIVRVSTNGELTPLFILWESMNGIEKYKVDKILSVEEHFSVVGGAGLRYECIINNHVRYLFYEKETRWFIESYKP